MSKARDLYREGHLAAAIEAANGEVRDSPGDSSRRIFLFELLAFAGDWDRALKQLDVLGQAGPKEALAVQVYKANVAAEQTRRRLFSEGLSPHFLTEPPPGVDLHLDAIGLVREGKLAEARSVLDRAEEERAALPGTRDGEPFSDFRDCDDLLGPVLEMIVKDKYTWMPFAQIRRLEVGAPSLLRDLVWARAKVEAADGTIGDVYLPALYEGTARHADDQVRLGRMTEWVPLSTDLARGAGLKTFLAGNDELGLFEAGQLTFQLPAPPASS